MDRITVAEDSELPSVFDSPKPAAVHFLQNAFAPGETFDIGHFPTCPPLAALLAEKLCVSQRSGEMVCGKTFMAQLLRPTCHDTVHRASIRFAPMSFKVVCSLFGQRLL